MTLYRRGRVCVRSTNTTKWGLGTRRRLEWSKCQSVADIPRQRRIHCHTSQLTWVWHDGDYSDVGDARAQHTKRHAAAAFFLLVVVAVKRQADGVVVVAERPDDVGRRKRRDGRRERHVRVAGREGDGGARDLALVSPYLATASHEHMRAPSVTWHNQHLDDGTSAVNRNCSSAQPRRTMGGAWPY